MRSKRHGCQKSENDLWDALTALDGGAQASLFAHLCASFAVNAVHEPANPLQSGSRLPPMAFARVSTRPMCWRASVGLDMVQAGWRPTVDNYLGRVTKPRILDAVRQAKGEVVGATDRPSEEGRHAPGRLNDFWMAPGWLPEPLRLLDPDAASEQERGGPAARIPRRRGGSGDRRRRRSATSRRGTVIIWGRAALAVPRLLGTGVRWSPFLWERRR